METTPLTLFRCVRSHALRGALRSAEPSRAEPSLGDADTIECVSASGGSVLRVLLGLPAGLGRVAALFADCRHVCQVRVGKFPGASFPLRSARRKTPRGTVADPFWVPFKDPDADPAGGGVV